MFTKIAIIGTGNVGTWLYQTLKDQDDLTVFFISSRKIERLPEACDLYIFALKDDVYEIVLRKISFKMNCAVHTSGSISQNILAPFAVKFGVFYPYQTITHNEMINPTSPSLPLIPICVEGCDPDFSNILFQWVHSIFSNVHIINEQQRFAMHLAAVFANNFTNALYGIAYQIFKENHLDWSLIFPLLKNTLEKAMYNDPALVQTGPAARNDISIMEKHYKTLFDDDLKTLYRHISKIIQSNNP